MHKGAKKIASVSNNRVNELLARLIAGATLGLTACATAPSPSPSGTPITFDLLITNGRIVDGTGNSWTRGDIAIKDGKIVAIGMLSTSATNGTTGALLRQSAKRVIDARDAIVSPGFIDVHAHIEFGLFDTPTADNFLHDGVTTVITGNCGGSADSLSDFFARIDRDKISMNVASLVGHNTVRREVMGLANRVASTEEQAKMEAHRPIAPEKPAEQLE